MYNPGLGKERYKGQRMGGGDFRMFTDQRTYRPCDREQCLGKNVTAIE
jgi:hypothetical protein